MPLYIDIHELHGATPDAVAQAHAADVEIQSKYGVEYVKYWFNEGAGKVFCLCHAPSAEAAELVHRDAHGLTARKIIEVQPEVAESFLGPGHTNAAGAVVLPGAGTDPGVRTIVFTDIVDSTTMTQRIGDQAAMEVIRVHDTIVRAALALVDGREVKHTGDGIMASFTSADSAVRCAARVQRELSRYAALPRDAALKVRIGAAAGEPVEHRNDLFGSTVQLAARLCAHAKPDQILVSGAVADLCDGKGLRLDEIGDVRLKGFDQPVRALSVDWMSTAS